MEKKCFENALGKSFECETCSEKFATMNYLNKHRKNHNMNSGPFQCEHCDKLFNEKWKHKAHLKTHKFYPLWSVWQNIQVWRIIRWSILELHMDLWIYSAAFTTIKVS